MSRRIRLACAWSGVVFLAVFFFGWVVLAGFIPPPRPSAGGQAIRAFFLDDLTAKRIGILLDMCVWSLLLPWGVAIAAQTRRVETGFPALTVIQIGCAISTMALGVLMMMIWGLAAFRPADIDPNLTRMLNDLGWFIFLIDWAPVAVWCWAVGLAILQDRGPMPDYPRWSAYLSFWAGLIFFPAGLIIFFKTGAFAFNGVFALYVPAAAFFIWYGVMTALTIRAIQRESRGRSIAAVRAQ